VETFGNIRKTPEGPRVDEEREPITDIFEEKEELVIIAEMPGIEELDISIELREDILEISAAGGGRKYRKELLLPMKAEPANLKQKFTNGILSSSFLAEKAVLESPAAPLQRRWLWLRSIKRCSFQPTLPIRSRTGSNRK
jgi:HSP20 family molecular chaperone IbpA